jgi:type IV secretion system protein TrbL
MGVVHCVTHPVSCAAGVAGSVASGVASDVFDQVATDFAHFAEHATSWVWQQLDAATALKLSGGQWNEVLRVTVELGVLVCVTMLLLQVIVCALRHDFGGLGRGVRGVTIAMIGTFASFVITDSLLSAVDSMSTGAMQVLAGTKAWSDLGNQVIHADTLTGGALGSAAMLLCALIMLVSSLVVWLALMVRKMLLIIGAVFAPIAFGGSPFDVTSSWVRRWIEFTVALVFSKLVLVILFGVGLQIELGLGKVGNATTQQVTQMMTGLLVMAIAGFAPWLALQFVHWAGSSMQWELHQRAQTAQAGGQAAIAAPQRMYAGAQRGFGGLAVAAGRLSSGASGNGSGSASGSGGNGSSHGGDAVGGGDGGSSRSPANGVTGTAESAYESGRNQTASALGQNGGGPAGGQQDSGQQDIGQQNAQARRDSAASGDGGDSGTPRRSDASGAGGPGQSPGPGTGSGGGSAGGGGDGGSPGAPSGPPSPPSGGGSRGSGGVGSPGGPSKPGGSPGGGPTGPGGGGLAGGAEIAGA